MPEQRLQRCRDAYAEGVVTYRITEANKLRLENRRRNALARVPLADLDKPWRESVAYRITQAQLAADTKK
jgi:hypothetical protein